MKQRLIRLRVPATVILALTVSFWPGCAKQAAPPSRKSPPAEPRPSAIVIDPQMRTVTVPAVVAEQEVHKELKGAIEYALVGKGGKEYETIFTTEHSAEEISAALTELGLRPGRPADEEYPPRGLPIEACVTQEVAGKTLWRPLNEFIVRVGPAPGKGQASRQGRPKGAPKPGAGKAPSPGPLESLPWVFTGSLVTTDPQTNRQVLQASLTQSIIGLHLSDASSLLQNPRPECRRENIYRANKSLLPPAGTPVCIVFQRPPPRAAHGARRVRALIAGRTRDVGYTTFVQGQARRLALSGFLRALDERRFEAVVEGPAPAVAEVLGRMRRGPLTARIEQFHVTDEPPEGDFRTFEIWY